MGDEFRNMKVESVGLGVSHLGIVCESKDDEKEKEFVLQSGQQIDVKVDESKSHKIYVQNAQLFGNSDWIQIKHKAKELVIFSYFGAKFVDNLRIGKDKKLIELVDCSAIDAVYHSDIL